MSTSIPIFLYMYNLPWSPASHVGCSLLIAMVKNRMNAGLRGDTHQPSYLYPVPTLHALYIKQVPRMQFKTSI